MWRDIQFREMLLLLCEGEMQLNGKWNIATGRHLKTS
jgi:hypothetical protein